MAIAVHDLTPTARTAHHGGAPHAARRLALLEASRLVRHPAFLAGCALTIGYFLNTHDEPNGAYLGLIGGGAMGPGLGLLLAANMATLRARADGTEELLEPAPVGVGQRTGALALATIGPAVASLVVVVACGIAVSLTGGVTVAFLSGHRHAWPSVIELLQVPTAVAAFGVLGIALGRWCPYRLASLLVAIATFFLLMPTFFWSLDGAFSHLMPLYDPSIDHHWVQVTPGTGYNVVTGFDTGAMAWHVLYLVGLFAALTGLSLVRHSAGRGAGRLLAAGVAVAALGGALQVG